MSAPHVEIVAAPLTLYLAPLGTAYPAIDTAEGSFAGAWVKVGTAGQNNYMDAGITVTHNQSISLFTPVGTTAPIKAWRTDEHLDISVQVADMSPAQVALALNNATVTTVAATTGVAGEKDVPLLMGTTVAVFAMVCRGISSVDDTLNCQYNVPAVYQSANPAPVWKKGQPADLALTFSTILDPSGGGFGNLVEQTAAKT